MRKLNTSILVGVAVAAIGALLVFFYGQRVDDRVADGKETKKVLVATEALTEGQTFEQYKEKVVEKDVPTDYLADGYLDDIDDLEGQVALGPVAKDGQLTAASFGSPEQAGAVAPSKGKIALAVSLDLSPGVARYITVGSSVDVFVTYASGITATPAGTGTTGSQSTSVAFASSRTKLAVSAVKVLSIDVAQRTQTTSNDDNQDDVAFSNNSSSQDTTSVVVVLDISPLDAEKVVNGDIIGELYLGLSAVQGSDPTVNKTPTGVVPDDVVRSNR